jgi:Glutathione S-transferase, C-terminal domain
MYAQRADGGYSNVMFPNSSTNSGMIWNGSQWVQNSQPYSQQQVYGYSNNHHQSHVSLSHSKSQSLLDLRNNMVHFASRGAPDKAASTVETAQKHFAKFNRLFQDKLTHHGGNGSTTRLFCVGDAFTAPDFHLFEMIDQYDVLCRTYGLEDCLGERFLHVRSFSNSFSELE